MSNQDLNDAEDAPKARDAIRLIGCFAKSVALTEELAREGRGGVVRIKELAPVLDAIKTYMAGMPKGTVER